MSKGKRIFLPALAAGLATVLMVGCGSGMGGGTAATTSGPPGSLITFGTDAPICDVESFSVTITSAALVPQGGGTPVPIISPDQPATVDFARLVDFTTILGTASVAPGTYDQLQLTLTNPQLTVLNVQVVPPAPVAVTTTFSNSSTTDTLSVGISPALTITSNATAGLMVDFNLRKSVQVGSDGQVTGTVDPQFALTPAVASGGQLGEADTLHGVVQSVTTTSTDPNFTGSFTLQVHGGVGQVLTVLVNSDTDFEGDGLTGLSTLTATTFVEVDAIVDTSGNIIAQEVDAEDQVAASNQRAGFMGEIIAVTRDSSTGNATQFNLLVGDETRDVRSEVPRQSSLTVTLQDTTRYWTNWHRWNRRGLQFGPQTLGLAERVAVFGELQAGSPPTLNARFVFLRQRNVLGNFTSLLTAGSDDRTGGFTMVPCGPLFQGQPITVLTFEHTRFRGVGGLNELTAQPTLNASGLLFYEQTSGPATQPTWTAPTWVMQGKVVRQLPQ
jgi:hypothetical protein